jgi:hypothetical protein
VGVAIGANALACYAGEALEVLNWVYEEQAKPLKQEHLIKPPRAFFLFKLFNFILEK